MSDEATCVYCGQARYGKEVLAPGAAAHTLCVYPDDPQRLSAEYAALAAGLDAVVTAFEREARIQRNLLRATDRAFSGMMARAEAAEARLAAARADGAWSFALMIDPDGAAGLASTRFAAWQAAQKPEVSG